MKNKTEIRAFTRQMNEEGRVEYSIGQWYDAEKMLAKKHNKFGSNRSNYPENYADLSIEERQIQLVHDGEFSMTLQEYLHQFADRIVSGGNSYDNKTNKYTYYCQKGGWQKALQQVFRMKHSIEVAIACRKAYPFVNALTCGSKPHSRNRRYAAAKEMWEGNTWSGVSYYKRTQQFKIGSDNSKIMKSWLNNKMWALIENQNSNANIVAWKRAVKQNTKNLEVVQAKIDKVNANFDNEEWVENYLKTKRERAIGYDATSAKNYEERIKSNQQLIDDATKVGLMTQEDIVAGIMGEYIELAPTGHEKTKDVVA